MATPQKNQLAIYQQFGDLIKAHRKDKGWSQEGLAEKSHLTRNFVSLIECGQANPSLLNIVNLAKALDIPTKKLFEDI